MKCECRVAKRKCVEGSCFRSIVGACSNLHSSHVAPKISQIIGQKSVRSFFQPTEDKTQDSTLDFADMTDTQARMEVFNTGISETDERNSEFEPAFEPSQQSEVQISNRLLSRFDDKYLSPTELDGLFDRVFQSRCETVEADESQFEIWWKELVCKKFAPKLTTPSGEVGKAVVQLFAEEMARGNEELEIPDARLLVCMMVILQKEKKRMNANQIKEMMVTRLNQWREGQYSALVKQALENEKKYQKTGYKRPPKDEAAVLSHASSMFSKYMRQGNIGAAMRWGMGGSTDNCIIVQPSDVIRTKNGMERVADILAAKYPPAAPVHREAVEEIIECSTIEEPAIFDVTPEEIERLATTMRGCAGPSGVDAANLERILTAHGDASLQFREALSARIHLLSRKTIPWSKVRAMRACQQIALATQIGTTADGKPIYKLRPIGAGEPIQRLMTRAVVAKTRDEFIAECGAINLCTGVRAGAEGIVHALQQAVREAARIGDREEPEILIKMDASDAFNNLSRAVALLHAGVKCPKSRQYVMNGYRGAALMVARGTHGSMVCRSKEGLIQGDPLAQFLYAIGSLPLLKKLRSSLLPPPQIRASIGVGVGLLRTVSTVDDEDASAAVDESDFEFVLRFDGGADAKHGARGVGSNSTVPVGAGAVLYRGGVESRHKVYERSIYLPAATVNDGEYTGVVAGLEACVGLGVKRVLVQGDSAVVLDQLSGRASINEPTLAAHYAAASRLLKKFSPGSVVFAKIRREANKRADELTHIARDRKQSFERFLPIVGNPYNNSPDYVVEANGDRSCRLDLQSLVGHSRLVRPLHQSQQERGHGESGEGGAPRDAGQLEASPPSPEGRRTVQCAFADDITGAGPMTRMLDWAELAFKLAPTYGIRFNPGKTGIAACDPSRVQEVQQAINKRPAFQGVEVTAGMGVLGCFVGTWYDASEFIEGKVKEWAKGLEHLVTVSKKDPQGLYTAVTSSFLGMPTYVQRGMGGEPSQYAPIERIMAEKVLGAIVPQARIGEGAREVYALPCRLGGLGLTDVTSAAQPNYDVALKATKVLVETLLGRCDWSKPDHDQHFSDVTSQHKTTKAAELQKEQEILLSNYVSRLPPPQKKATQNAMQKSTHYFLVSKPTESHGSYLSPDEFRDAIAIRYGFNPSRVNPTCPQCNGENDLAHALTCKYGGNRVGRHNIVRDEVAHLCRTAFGRTAYSTEVEPWVRKDAAGGLQDLRADIGVRGLDQVGKVTMLDVRICHPVSKEYPGRSTADALNSAEVDKTAKYGEACRENGWLFRPFVMSTDGVLGDQAETVVRRIGESLSQRWRISNSRAITWARNRLAVALAKGCSACIRGDRGRGRGGADPTRGGGSRGAADRQGTADGHDEDALRGGGQRTVGHQGAARGQEDESSRGGGRWAAGCQRGAGGQEDESSRGGDRWAAERQQMEGCQDGTSFRGVGRWAVAGGRDGASSRGGGQWVAVRRGVAGGKNEEGGHGVAGSREAASRRGVVGVGSQGVVGSQGATGSQGVVDSQGATGSKRGNR